MTDVVLVDEAKIPVQLGLGNIDGVTGRYWGNTSVSDTGDGQVMEWWHLWCAQGTGVNQ